MSKALQFIHSIARKLLAQEGKGITSIANRLQAEAKAGEIAETFRLSGLTPNKWNEFIKSENDVVKYLNIIESSTKPKVKQSIQPKPLMQSSKPGDVIDFPPERITDWTKARPQPPEIETINGVQTTRGMGDLFAKQMKNIGKKDPALYEDRGGNIIPAQFKDATKETEAQILQRLNKGNKEGIASMKSKLDDAEDLSEGTYSFGFKKGKEFQLNANSMGKGTLKEIIDSGELSGADLEAAINALKNRKADGGRAGLYQGGQAQIEPDLSGIGHGSDALMARNMLIAPGSQATTSTGLNYLLGEDNDTTRVPYKEAGPVVLPKPKPKPNADPLVELQRIYDLYQESMPGVSQETQKYLQQDFIQKLNDAGISQEQFMTNQMQNNFAEGGPARQGFKMGKRAFLQWIGRNWRRNRGH
jgi:hypothetical protein